MENKQYISGGLWAEWEPVQELIKVTNTEHPEDETQEIFLDADGLNSLCEYAKQYYLCTPKFDYKKII